MVSKETRNHAWGLILDLERLARYYGRLTSRLSWQHSFGTTLIAFAATSACISLLDILPSQVELAANAVIVVVALWMLAGNLSQKQVVVRSVAERCRELETDARALWLRLGSLEETEAQQQWENLEKEMNRVTSKPESVGLRNNDALNEKCAAEAYEVVRHEFPARS